MKIKEMFSSLSRRNNERKAVNETVSVSGENIEQKENNSMPNENTNNTVETKPVEETKKEEVVDKPTDKKEIETETVEKDKEVPQNEQVAEETTGNEPTQVQETTPSGNGIPLDQVVTKDYLKQMLDSFSAKYEAVVKENEDLKAKLVESNGKVTEMQDKYENKDFGGYTKQGVQTKDKNANDTFDEYSKQFM